MIRIYFGMHGTLYVLPFKEIYRLFQAEKISLMQL